MPYITMCQGPKCTANGAGLIIRDMEDLAFGVACVEASGCMGQCSKGPNGMFSEKSGAKGKITNKLNKYSKLTEMLGEVIQGFGLDEQQSRVHKVKFAIRREGNADTRMQAIEETLTSFDDSQKEAHPEMFAEMLCLRAREMTKADPVAAYNDLRDALKLLPDWPWAFVSLAQVLDNLHMPRGALASMQRAIEIGTGVDKNALTRRWDGDGDTLGADIQDSPADAMLIVGDYTLPPSSTARVTYAPCESAVMHGGKNGCLTAHALQLAYKMKDHFYWFFIVDDDTYVSHRNAVMALIKRVPKKELLALGYIGCGGQHCPDRRLGGGGFCGGAYALSVSTLEKIFNQSNGSSRHKVFLANLTLGKSGVSTDIFFGCLLREEGILVAQLPSAFGMERTGDALAIDPDLEASEVDPLSVVLFHVNYSLMPGIYTTLRNMTHAPSSHQNDSGLMAMGCSKVSVKGNSGILFIIRTRKQNLDTRLRAINETWFVDVQQSSSDALLVVGNYEIPNPPVSQAIMCSNDHGMGLTCMTVYALELANRLRDHFAWFFVVDDDLYMNRENANLALSAFDPSTEIALGIPGCGTHLCNSKGGFCGGGGYVLSRGAMKHIMSPDVEAFNKDFMSHLAGGHGEEVYDDVTVGCLVQRHHIRYEHLKGLYGWKLNGDTSTIPNSEYKKSIRMRKPLPITFHYVDPKTIRAIHAEFDLLKNPNPVAGTEMSYQILGSLSSLKKNLRGVIGKEATHAVLTSLNKSIMDMMNNGGTGSAMFDSLNKTFADILGNGTGSAMFGPFNHSFSDFIGNGTNPAFFGSFNQSFTDFWGNGTGSAILGSFNHSLSDFIGNGTGSGILGSLNQSFTGFSGSGTSYRVGMVRLQRKADDSKGPDVPPEGIEMDIRYVKEKSLAGEVVQKTEKKGKDKGKKDKDAPSEAQEEDPEKAEKTEKPEKKEKPTKTKDGKEVKASKAKSKVKKDKSGAAKKEAPKEKAEKEPETTVKADVDAAVPPDTAPKKVNEVKSPQVVKSPKVEKEVVPEQKEIVAKSVEVLKDLVTTRKSERTDKELTKSNTKNEKDKTRKHGEKKKKKTKKKKPEKSEHGEYQEWQLRNIEWANHDCVRLSFACKGKPSKNFESSIWHIDLAANLGPDGEEIQRSYTPYSTAEEYKKGILILIVKVYPTGLMSSYLGKMKPGETILVSTPVPTIDPADYPEGAIMVAGGSAVVVALQVITAMLPLLTDSFHLYLCNRKQEDVLLMDEFNALMDAYPQKFQMTNCLSQDKSPDNPQGRSKWSSGRLNADQLKTAPLNLKVLISGPDPLCKMVALSFLELGKQEDDIACLDTDLDDILHPEEKEEDQILLSRQTTQRSVDKKEERPPVSDVPRARIKSVKPMVVSIDAIAASSPRISRPPEGLGLGLFSSLFFCGCKSSDALSEGSDDAVLRKT
eukprot:symbB.v1.2.002861.t1/scaffold130.1/size334612/12